MLFLGLTDFDDVTSEVIPELATEWSVSGGRPGLDVQACATTCPGSRYNPATGEVTVMTDDEGNPAHGERPRRRVRRQAHPRPRDRL